MVSSIFHHLCILKLEVHPTYLDFLTTGRAPPPNQLDECWYKPKMSRSKWFDLLTAEGRLEAFRGIWAVMSYQMRADPMTRKPSQRKASEARGAFSRRSLIMPLPSLKQQRSQSVAF